LLIAFIVTTAKYSEKALCISYSNLLCSSFTNFRGKFQ